MIIQLIKYRRYPWNYMGGSIIKGSTTYAGRQGDRIVTDTTREKVIAKLCAHPNSWLARFGRPIQEFSDKELVDVIKQENA